AEESAQVPERGGMRTEREQVSYAIGMQIGESLKGVRDEVDLATVFKAVRSTVDGKEPLLSQQDVMEVMQGFGMRMQARQMEEFARMSEENEQDVERFLAENAGKVVEQTTALSLKNMAIQKCVVPKQTPVFTN